MAQKTATLNIRINPEVKAQAEVLYNSFGITITDAINMFLTRSLAENGLPFELKLPRYNKQTEDAIDEGKQLMQDMKSGKSQGYTDVDELLGDLYA